MSGIMQDWTLTLGLRHQGVLVSAVRGCDTAAKEAPSKSLTRYLRAAVLNAHCGDATQAQGFIEVPTIDGFERAIKGFMAEKDALPVHYVMHFMHAAEIVGYYHPDKDVRSWWRIFYERMCRKLHVTPERKQDLDARLNADEDSFGAEQRSP